MSDGRETLEQRLDRNFFRFGIISILMYLTRGDWPRFFLYVIGTIAFTRGLYVAPRPPESQAHPMTFPLRHLHESSDRLDLIVAALEYGARYCDEQAKKWAKEVMRPQRDQDRLDREFRQEAIANERAFEERAHRMRMLLASPSRPE